MAREAATLPVTRRHPQSSALPSWLRQVLETGMIVALVGGGWIAWQALAFRVPTWAVEALLPRL